MSVSYWQERISAILKILNEFRWLTDCYVIEFFVENLWLRLPACWRQYLENCELCDVLKLIDYSQPFNESDNGEPAPLSLLALRQCCCTYSINRKFDQINPTDLQELFGEDETKIFLHRFASEILTDKCQKLPRPLNIRLKKKKLHELQRLGHLVDALVSVIDKAGTTVIDVGSGCGHLARYLSVVKGLPTVAVELERYLVEKARLLDGFVQKFIPENRVLPKYENRRFSSSIADVSIDNGCLLIGLHTCGDLADEIIDTFSGEDRCSAVISLGCCYMKTSGRRMSTSTGRPLSQFLAAQEGGHLSYESRELACHALEQFLKKARENGGLEHLRVHCFRATFEALVALKVPGRRRQAIGNVKWTDGMSFDDYLRSAMRNFDDIIVEEILSSLSDQNGRELNWNEYIDQWKRVAVFYCVRQLLAPLVESAILIDRLLFLKERNFSRAGFVPIFDEEVSARNIALVAIK